MFIVDNSMMVMDFGLTKDNFNKLAMFDFDNTLATYNGRDRIAIWQFQFKNVKDKLHELHRKGYKIVVLSNQSQITSNQKTHKDFVRKIEDFQRSLDLPILVLVPQNRDKYRKPSIWSYKWLKENYFPGKKLEDSFYVGDAAGVRENAPYPINCDLYFAKNAGLTFYLPEEYFLNKEPNYIYNPINIREMPSAKFEVQNKRIIFLYGPKKYNGKSFFVRKYYPNHKVFDFPQAYSKECVYLNCNNLDFLKKIINENPLDCKIYLLDYPHRVESWLKEFYYVSGQYEDKSFSPVKPQVLDFIKDKCTKVPFIFDDSNFNEEELEISKFILE